MHRLLERQIARATSPAGELDVGVLMRFVDAAYAEADLERVRNDRAMLLTCEEMDTLNVELRQLAHHDGLTGLPNRVSFAEAALRAIQRARQGESLAVLLVDLDRFKAINDALGHAMGDALLCEVAARLRSAVREGDTVARMGGDEFAILQVGRERSNAAQDLAHRVVDRLSAPYVHRRLQSFRRRVGRRRALADRVCEDVDLLLLNADRALYRAKNEGRCTWRIHEPQPAQRQPEEPARSLT